MSACAIGAWAAPTGLTEAIDGVKIGGGKIRGNSATTLMPSGVVGINGEPMDVS